MIGVIPQGPHSHILVTGGGGSPSDFFGSEILAKSDFLGFMKDAGIFLSNAGIFWVAKKELTDFFGYAKKVMFLGRQILKL